MTSTNRPGPLDSAERLLVALGEQGLPPAEATELAPALMQLAEWRAPAPGAAQTARLIQALLPHVPAAPLRVRPHTLWHEMKRVVLVARAQVSVLRPSFWAASAVIALGGAALATGQTDINRAFLLQMVGPLLSYLGTSRAFQGASLNVLEFELACPPSLRQLTLARLSLVLGYDIALGLLLSVLLGSDGREGFLAFTLHWLAPLLLVSGVTLFLSLRLAVNRAAVVTYAGWMLFVTASLVAQQSGDAPLMSGALSHMGEWVAAALGVGLLGAAISLLPGRWSVRALGR